MSKSDDRRKKLRVQGGCNQNKSKGDKFKTNIEITPTFGVEFDPTVNISQSLFRNIIINESGEWNLNDAVKHLSNKDPAKIILINDYLSTDKSKFLMNYFQENLNWIERKNATKDGIVFVEPRKTCWFGKPYAYSAVQLESNVIWDDELLKLRESLQTYAKPNEPFNSVFCNLYETAKNSIAWHSDNEKSLGVQPTIASLSLGTSRTFELSLRDEFYGSKQVNSHKSRDENKPPFERCSVLYQVELQPGSLLIMSGSTQDYWLHRIPKEYHDREARINFTFRHIV